MKIDIKLVVVSSFVALLAGCPIDDGGSSGSDDSTEPSSGFEESTSSGTTTGLPEGPEPDSCIDSKNGICAEIRNYDEATPADFEAKCLGDGGIFDERGCADTDQFSGQTPVFLCDGIDFTVNGLTVTGVAYFYGNIYTCEQMQEICASSKGQPGGC